MDARTAVSKCVSDGCTQRITVRFEEDILDSVDALVKEGDEFENRSELIRAAVWSLVESEGELEHEEDREDEKDGSDHSSV